MTVRLTAFLAIAASLGLACEPYQPSVPRFEGRTIADRASFRPGALPYAKGELILAERTSIPVTMESKAEEDGRVTFTLKAHGEVVETETYLDSPEQFCFVSRSNESFDPPLPLLVYPVRVGQTPATEWKGKVVEGDTQSNAHAIVTWSDEASNLPAPFSETIKAHVVLTLYGAGEPTKRELAFWFVEERGIVKRNFGTLDTRQPAQP